jgi:hypothetical protein
MVDIIPKPFSSDQLVQVFASNGHPTKWRSARTFPAFYTDSSWLFHKVSVQDNSVFWYRLTWPPDDPTSELVYTHKPRPCPSLVRTRRSFFLFSLSISAQLASLFFGAPFYNILIEYLRSCTVVFKVFATNARNPTTLAVFLHPSSNRIEIRENPGI